MDTGNDFLRPSKIGIRKESSTFSISQSNQQLTFMASGVLSLGGARGAGAVEPEPCRAEGQENGCLHCGSILNRLRAHSQESRVTIFRDRDIRNRGIIAFYAPRITRQFGRAVARGTPNAKTYLNYAELLGETLVSGSTLVRLLEKALQLEPDNCQTRLKLASIYLRELRFEPLIG